MGLLDAPQIKAPLSPRGRNGIAWIGDSLTANGSGNGSQTGQAVGTFNTTATAGATSLSLGYTYTVANGYASATPPGSGATYVLEPGTAREEYVWGTAISGSGPYTLTLQSGTTYTHAAGSEYRNLAGLHTGQSIPMWVSILTNSRMRFAGLFAHGGYTPQQIRDIYLPQVLAMSPLPGAVVLNAGTNGGYNLATDLPVVTGMIDTLMKRGILPVVTGAIPTGSTGPTSAQIVTRMKWNVALSAACERRGIPFVDVYAPLTATDGGMVPAYAADTVHPNQLGAKTWAQAIVTALSAWWPFSSDPIYPPANVINSDTATFPLNFNNALLLTDSNADGIPDSWAKDFSSTGGDSVALVTEAGVPGKMVAVTRSASSTGNCWLSTPAFTLVPQHKYRLYLRIKTSGVTTANANGGTFGYRTIASNQDPLFSLNSWGLDISTVSTLIADFRVPAGLTVTSSKLVLDGGASTPAFTVQIQPWLVDLTALGAD